jgi:hypothetical protein
MEMWGGSGSDDTRSSPSLMHRRSQPLRSHSDIFEPREHSRSVRHANFLLSYLYLSLIYTLFLALVTSLEIAPVLLGVNSGVVLGVLDYREPFVLSLNRDSRRLCGSLPLQAHVGPDVVVENLVALEGRRIGGLDSTHGLFSVSYLPVHALHLVVVHVAAYSDVADMDGALYFTVGMGEFCPICVVKVVRPVRDEGLGNLPRQVRKIATMSEVVRIIVSEYFKVKEAG